MGESCGPACDVTTVTNADFARFAEATGYRTDRDGLDGAKYPWGDQEPDDGGWRADIRQGSFPQMNTLDDGWLTTTPDSSMGDARIRTVSLRTENA